MTATWANVQRIKKEPVQGFILWTEDHCTGCRSNFAENYPFPILSQKSSSAGEKKESCKET
ncbi:hypothetical protein SAMN02910263_03351 [Butyrivibrio sp. INlla16]|nr:hypothetical protein SAMN02910263_02577 [Butyrivibrio sp. INlla16]SDB62241.1 hypothetical protein SAMN02910263_03351 [Butyrivibrio sp. INlla16]